MSLMFRPLQPRRSSAWAFSALLIATTSPVNAQTPASPAQADLRSRAEALHRRIIVLDSHSDVLLPTTPENLWAAGHTSRTDVAKLKRGGVSAIAIAVAVGSGPRTPQGLSAARAEADAKRQQIRAFVAEHAADVELALSADDVDRIHKAGKIAVIQSFLNARSLGPDVGAIGQLSRDGIRLFGFTHAGNNEFADSSRPSAGTGEEHHGLSPLGAEAVGALNRSGVIIDVSQLTPAGLFQTLALTKVPVVASHSNVRALVEATRNLSDKELDAIKNNGGVVHVTPFNAYLKALPQDYDRRLAQLRLEFGLGAATGSGPAALEQGIATLTKAQADEYLAKARALTPKATVSDLVDHIEYIVRRIGIDHVGIGTDFNHGSGIQGFDDESQAPNVTAELLRRGYTEPQIAKIWGGNFLRVFRAVTALAEAR